MRASASPVRRIATALRHGLSLGLRLLWALPVSVLGLVLALPVLVGRGNVRFLRGQTVALLVHGPVADWLLKRHPAGAMNAMALGHLVVAAASGLNTRVLTHEMEHVRQAERWGLLFPFLYLASSAWHWLHGRNAYWNNHFEVAARAAERQTDGPLCSTNKAPAAKT